MKHSVVGFTLAAVEIFYRLGKTAIIKSCTILYSKKIIYQSLLYKLVLS